MDDNAQLNETIALGWNHLSTGWNIYVIVLKFCELLIEEIIYIYSFEFFRDFVFQQREGLYNYCTSFYFNLFSFFLFIKFLFINVISAPPSQHWWMFIIWWGFILDNILDAFICIWSTYLGMRRKKFMGFETGKAALTNKNNW